MLRLVTRFGRMRFTHNFLSGANADYLETMYARWLEDQKSVSLSFHAFFKGIKKGLPQDQIFSSVSPSLQISSQVSKYYKITKIADIFKLKLLVEKYRVNGHVLAQTDPLQLDKSVKQYGFVPNNINFGIQQYGFTQADLDREFDVSSIDLTNLQPNLTLRELISYLRRVYCGKVGFEYMHLISKEQREFIKSKIEDYENFNPSPEYLKDTFDRLCSQWVFQNFLKKKFSNQKRFGVEGCQTAVSGINKLAIEASKVGIQNIVLGMAHRGRLNTLYTCFGKSAKQIIKQFQDIRQYDQFSFAGDVKYHLGVTTERTFPNQKTIIMSLLPNPSHLEAVNPLVYGRTRAIQDLKQDHKRQKAIGILVHGDAAIAGQGIVYESLQMQDLKDYTTGGIIHLVINNQIGFTTPSNQTRSSSYCTQIGKVVNSPIFHVNANQPQLVDKCMQIALSYRNKYKKDVFIDIVGYRKFGHNQQDQPFFTQPLMYQKIRELQKQKKDVFSAFTDKLLKNKILSSKQIDSILQQKQKSLQKIYEQVPIQQAMKIQQIDTQWYHPKGQVIQTGLKQSTINQIFSKLMHYPPNFHIHPTIKKIYQTRKYNFQKNQGLDWATMESLAFGSLLKQGYGVRLSGQDVQRGTFSHRHAVLKDQEQDRQKFLFLSNISKNASIINSHLSQYGVLGFEYGYSITNYNYLVCWQAQFGDFANGAQILIDNFIVSSQSKWSQKSAIVMLLPHGMDGQGPQHSSGRVQRFLQLSDDDPQVYYKYKDKFLGVQLENCNIQVVICSTSANYFHVLRRQMHRNFRKPLIVFNSKKLLKFKGVFFNNQANSLKEEIGEGTEFKVIYKQVDPKIKVSEVKTIIFCTGQFYYTLLQARAANKKTDISIIRIEQLAPFPYQQVLQALKDYKDLNKKQILWVQQEHQNHGGWHYVNFRFKMLLKTNQIENKIHYIGRKSLSASAVGTLTLHKREQGQILNKIFK